MADGVAVAAAAAMIGRCSVLGRWFVRAAALVVCRGVRAGDVYSRRVLGSFCNQHARAEVYRHAVQDFTLQDLSCV